MPPNFADTAGPSYSATATEDVSPEIKPEDGPSRISAENGNIPTSAPVQTASQNELRLKTFTASVNSLAHILIGAVTGITLIFAFSNGVPLSATPLHITLCVIGYQFLMAEAILSLSTSNGWSTHLRLVDKRRAHYVMQIMGSVLAITGSFIKILDKDVHWQTLHGRFALVALVFTSVSLVNGLTALWAHELRRIIPGNLSKLSHICFGTVGFTSACICLCYGLDKGMFRNRMTDAVSYTVITMTAAVCFIVILAPGVTFYQKSISLIRR